MSDTTVQPVYVLCRCGNFYDATMLVSHIHSELHKRSMLELPTLEYLLERNPPE